MGLPLILAAIQAAGGIGGAIQGNQRRQQQKGEIGRAYKLGQQRLALRQGDVRQGTGESLVARGLAQGGNVRVGRGAVPLNTREVEHAKMLNTAGRRFTGAKGNLAPVPAVVPIAAVTGARDLGGQVRADLGREQQLEQNALKQQRDSALAGANADATGALIGGIGQAVAGGIQGYQTGTMYANAFGNIDPVRPLERGAWAQPSVDALNIYSQRG